VKTTIQLFIAAGLVAAAVLAPAAAGSPEADLASVGNDYARDEKVTPCRFTQAQLESARGQITEDVETYAKGLRAAIVREIKRWKDGACKGKRGGAGNLRIVGVQARGGAQTESVTIKNAGKKAVDLRGYALRDAADHTLKFRKTKLAAGRKLRVLTGCRSGQTSAVRRGTSYYACRKNEVWDDAGDTVELLGPGGGLLAKKTY
jgi:hypothetical protein